MIYLHLKMNESNNIIQNKLRFPPPEDKFSSATPSIDWHYQTGCWCAKSFRWWILSSVDVLIVLSSARPIVFFAPLFPISNLYLPHCKGKTIHFLDKFPTVLFLMISPSSFDWQFLKGVSVCSFHRYEREWFYDDIPTKNTLYSLYLYI